jgi:uncharacterized protein (DUF2147 family)
VIFPKYNGNANVTGQKSSLIYHFSRESKFILVSGCGGGASLTRYASFALTLLSAGRVFAADPLNPVGLWKTIDDKTGSAKALVRIFERNGELFGKVETGLNERKERVCDLCKDERKNKPIVGMEVIRHMKKSGDDYEGGDILDPDTGKVYRCKLRVEDGGKKLDVRGFLGISLLGRTQTWVRKE